MSDIFGGNARAIVFLVLNFWAGMIVVAPMADKPAMAAVATIWTIFFLALFWKDLVKFLRGRKTINPEVQEWADNQKKKARELRGETEIIEDENDSLIKSKKK